MTIDAKFGVVSGAEFQVDLRDNNTEYVDLGAITDTREVVLDWTFEKPTAGTAMEGQFRIIQSGGTVNLDEFYSYVSELSSVTFSAGINAGRIRLVIVTAAVGENPKFRYKKETIRVAI